MRTISKEDWATIAGLIQKYGWAAIEKKVARESTATPTRGAGAPPLNRGFWACVWANIEVRRDRGPNLKPLSIRVACAKLAEILEKRWKNVRPPPGRKRLRGTYNEAKKLRTADPEFRKLTDDMLATIKTRLKHYGPDAVSFPALQLPNDFLPLLVEVNGTRSALLAGYVAVNVVLHNRQPDQE